MVDYSDFIWSNTIMDKPSNRQSGRELFEILRGCAFIVRYAYPYPFQRLPLR